MSIFQRTIKLVVATTVAILLAQMIGLTFATSAGVIAILSLLDTRKSSLKIAWRRFLSAVLGLVIAIALFYVFGFKVWVISLYIAVYVPLAYYWKLESGIPPITVLVLHLYSLESVLPLQIINEVGLLLVGTITALALNAYMPSKQGKIDAYHSVVEKDLRAILMQFAMLLKNGDGSNDGNLIDELEITLSAALELVYIESNNQIFQSTNYQVHYFEMRREQEKILKGMSESITATALDLRSEESQLLSQLFEGIAQQLSQENPAAGLMEDLQSFRSHFRERSLPATREEFESRALLFQLLGDLERFIQLKVDFYRSYQMS